MSNPRRQVTVEPVGGLVAVRATDDSIGDEYVVAYCPRQDVAEAIAAWWKDSDLPGGGKPMTRR